MSILQLVRHTECEGLALAATIRNDPLLCLHCVIFGVRLVAHGRDG